MRNFLPLPSLSSRQKMVCALLLLCLLLSAGGFLFGSIAGYRSRNSAADIREALRGMDERLSALEEEHTGTGAREYLLMEHEGKIGVFSAEKTALYEILDVRISTLPARDRQMLAAGITVVGEEALRSILEDYSS